MQEHRYQMSSTASNWKQKVLQPEILNGFHMATDHGDCNCTWHRPHRKHMKRTLQSVTICAIKHRNGRDIDRKLPQCEIRCGWEPPEHSDQKCGKSGQNSIKLGKFLSLKQIICNNNNTTSETKYGIFLPLLLDEFCLNFDCICSNKSRKNVLYL